MSKSNKNEFLTLVETINLSNLEEPGSLVI